MATGVVFYRWKADVCPCIEGHSNERLVFTLMLYYSAWLTAHCKSREAVSQLTLTCLSLYRGPEIVYLGWDGALRQFLCLASVQTLPVSDSLKPQVFSRSWAWRKAACQGGVLLVHPPFHAFPLHWRSKTSMCLLSLSLQGCKAWSGKRQVRDNSLTVFSAAVWASTIDAYRTWASE